jgi:hypothetical protein
MYSQEPNMTPEEKERLAAETQKLQAETASLKKGGWGRPSSWIPMMAAVAAVSTSLGQFQMSSINDREASLDAREKAIEAKEEESRLVEKNAKLELRAQELTQEIAAATSDSIKLNEEIQKANQELLAIAQDADTDGKLVARVERENTERTEKAATIVASAERRNADAQITNLVWKMNSDQKSVRLAAVAELIEGYESDAKAIAAAIDLLTMPQLESLSSSGRINVLVFLRNTDVSVWNEGLKEGAVSAIGVIRKRSAQGKSYIGPQTDSALAELEKTLAKIE